MRLNQIQKGEAFTITALQSGRDCPLTDFLIQMKKETPDEVAKIIALIDRTAEHGVPKNKQKVNTLGNELFEFKTSGGLRVIWFYDAGQIILCTHGFVKKRQTTPKNEIKRALRSKKEYEIAKKSGNLFGDT